MWVKDLDLIIFEPKPQTPNFNIKKNEKIN